MRQISPEDAEKNYGIKTNHTEMDNGQLRFRLEKDDGTKYVLTIAGNNRAWQNSHFHKYANETYIVQRGWIGYAEFVEDKLKMTVYWEGDIFTTRPHSIHNVYLPCGAVIHTVKHGNASVGDWQAFEKFDEMTKHLTEKEIFQLATKAPASCKHTPLGSYSEEYRHFDNLIWHAPAWCTAIFVGALIGGIRITKSSTIVTQTTLTEKWLLGIFLGIVFLFISALMHSIYRFRKHQEPFKTHRTPFWASGQFYLHSMVRLQAFSILAVIMILAGLSHYLAVSISLVFFAVFTCYHEFSVRWKSFRDKIKPRNFVKVD